MAENLQIAPQVSVEQSAQQTGQQVRMHLDERNMKTSYANFFRTNGSADEVMIDFGLNTVMPSDPQQKNQPEFMVQVTDRIVLNYYNVKSLALTLGQLIRRHEEQFGELELDPSKRTRKN